MWEEISLCYTCLLLFWARCSSLIHSSYLLTVVTASSIYSYSNIFGWPSLSVYRPRLESSVSSPIAIYNAKFSARHTVYQMCVERNTVCRFLPEPSVWLCCIPFASNAPSRPVSTLLPRYRSLSESTRIGPQIFVPPNKFCTFFGGAKRP